MYIFQKNESRQIDFLNFKDAHDGANGAPISYVDDNDCWLTPFTSKNSEILHKSECSYSIHLNNNYELFVYLLYAEC